MEFAEAYQAMMEMELSQEVYDRTDRLMRRLEKCHNPPSCIVNFEHLLRVLDERSRRGDDAS